MRLSALRSPAVLLLCAWFPGVDVASAAEESPNRHSVKAVGAVQADVDRAVVVLHGRLRDADVYWRDLAQRVNPP